LPWSKTIRPLWLTPIGLNPLEAPGSLNG
jgi:hypothetical protein